MILKQNSENDTLQAKITKIYENNVPYNGIIYKEKKFKSMRMDRLLYNHRLALRMNYND